MSEAGPVGVEAEQQREPQQAEPVEEAAEREQAEPVATQTERRHAVVAVPGSRREEPKPSFWRRIGLRALGRAEGGLRSATHDDRLIARLDALTGQVAECERATTQRIEELDRKFSQVWEVEETLSRLMELRELLTDMRDRQGRVDGRLRSLERRLSFIALLAGVAAVAGVVAVLAAFAP